MIPGELFTDEGEHAQGKQQNRHQNFEQGDALLVGFAAPQGQQPRHPLRQPALDQRLRALGAIEQQGQRFGQLRLCRSARWQCCRARRC